MMAFMLLVICIAVNTAFGVPLNQNLGEHSRFIDIEDDDGITHKVDLDAALKMALLPEIRRDPFEIDYSLYTRENPDTEQMLISNDTESIETSYFNPERPTVVVVHGLLRNQYQTMGSSLRDVLLETSDVNVIVMDWWLASQDYVTATAGTPAVGRFLAQFLAFLHETTEAPYETMHLVGFSLGAHLVGNAGRALDGKIGRITGLDPAGPLWSFSDFRINKDDGLYVEIIHTDGGRDGLGLGLPSGDVDFFPNGGDDQPGCLTRICKHNRAWQFFDASVRFNHLLGWECTNIVQIALNTCRGQRLHMGNNDLTKRGSGLYRVNTGRIYPF